MRHLQYIILSFSLLLFATSCEDNLGDKYGYNGDWALINVSGGFGGGGVPVPWDNITLDGNDFFLYDNDELLLSARIDYTEGDVFDLVDFDFSSHSEGIVLIFDTFREKEIIIDEYGLMTISDGCCDLFSYTFERF